MQKKFPLLRRLSRPRAARRQNNDRRRRSGRRSRRRMPTDRQTVSRPLASLKVTSALMKTSDDLQQPNEEVEWPPGSDSQGALYTANPG